MLDADYLLRTWHPDTRPPSLDLDDRREWTGLEILGTTGGGMLHTTGTVDFVVSDIPSVQGLIQQGRMHAIAVTSMERHPVLPTIPTVNESGLPGYEMIAWAGVFAPASTPAPIVQKLNGLFRYALASPEGQAFYSQAGLKPEPGSPEQLGQHVTAQLEKWSAVVKAAGIQPE